MCTPCDMCHPCQDQAEAVAVSVLCPQPIQAMLDEAGLVASISTRSLSPAAACLLDLMLASDVLGLPRQTTSDSPQQPYRKCTWFGYGQLPA